MSEPTSSSDPTPPVPPAPSFTYGTPTDPAPASAPSAPLPPPQYGERVPGHEAAPAYSAPAYGAPDAPVPVTRRRVWDIVLTIVLLVLGLFGMGIGLVYAAIFSDPVLVREILDETYRQAGLGGWNGAVGAAPAIIAVSHIVLYLVALGVSILLLVRNKIAFWVPLSAGVIAAIVFWGAMVAIVLSDPAFMTGALR